MEATTFTNRQQTNSFFIHLLCAAAFTTFLFFIDEGYYSFKWMREAGNWLLFAIYTFGILSGQIVTQFLILRQYTGKYKMLFSCLIGVPLGTAILFAVFYALVP